MTEVRYTERTVDDGLLLRLYACGHSGLFENGVDIGCRCASILISALVNIADIAEEQYKCAKNVSVGEGVSSIEITVPKESEKTEFLKGLYFTARQGLCALSRYYPDNFSYEEKIN